MTQCEICGARTGLHGFSFEAGAIDPPKGPFRGQCYKDDLDRFWVFTGESWVKWELTERESNGAWLSLSEGEWVEDDS